MRIIFAGTPDFAAEALRALIDAGHDIALVLSQPDRPSGRGMKLTASPVKNLAIQHGIEVLTPTSLSLKRCPEEAANIHHRLQKAKADLLVVAAYGLILPQEVLNCATGIGRDKELKAINIHASLLPRWRGAAPIARSIEAGDEIMGVTLMKMELGLDTGPIIAIAKTQIAPDETTSSLTERLARMGGELLVEALKHPDDLCCTPQPKEGVTYAAKLLKEEARIQWEEPAAVIERRLRAFTPFPGIYFMKGDTPVKIWKAEVIHDPKESVAPGTVLSVKNALTVSCGKGALRAHILQRPGKPRMEAGPFLQSLPFVEGEVLA